MKRTSLLINASDLEAALLPRLLGQVSHVTTPSALTKILHDQALKPDQNASNGYGSTNSDYFRSIHCLSLTDLRSVTREEVDRSLSQFYFLNPPFAEANHPVFFLFLPQVHNKLIHWSAWKNRRPTDGIRIVAPTEAGYPEEIPLTSVDEVIEVEVLPHKAKLGARSGSNGTLPPRFG